MIRTQHDSHFENLNGCGVKTHLPASDTKCRKGLGISRLLPQNPGKGVSGLNRSVEPEQFLSQTAPRRKVLNTLAKRRFLDLSGRIVATEIRADVDGDAFFDPIDPADWVEVHRLPQPVENGLPYDLVHYRRRVASMPREGALKP